MRLIDADEFKKQMASMALVSPSYFTSKVVKLLEIIDKQPTVEAVPVVHGEWRHIGGDEWGCTSCGHVISTEGSWEKPTAKFCEECGADMRKKV